MDVVPEYCVQVIYGCTQFLRVVQVVISKSVLLVYSNSSLKHFFHIYLIIIYLFFFFVFEILWTKIMWSQSLSHYRLFLNMQPNMAIKTVK